MLQPECGAKVVVEKKTIMIKDAHQFGNVPVFSHPLSLWLPTIHGNSIKTPHMSNERLCNTTCEQQANHKLH